MPKPPVDPSKLLMGIQEVTGHVVADLDDTAGLASDATLADIRSKLPILRDGRVPVEGVVELRSRAVQFVSDVSRPGGVARVVIEAPGAGKYICVTKMVIYQYRRTPSQAANGAYIVTTQNLSGNLVYLFSSAGNAGVTSVQDIDYNPALRAQRADTAVSFECNDYETITWAIHVGYCIE